MACKLITATAEDKWTPSRKRSTPDNPTCDEDASDFNCSICTELLVEPVTGICGHEFCKYCLEKWRGSTPNPRTAVLCPRCRGVIASNPTKPFGVCRLLERVLRKMFPEEYSRRLLEVKQAREQDAKAVQDQVEAHVAAVQSMLADSLHPGALQQPSSPLPLNITFAVPSQAANALPQHDPPPTQAPNAPPTASMPSASAWLRAPGHVLPSAPLPPLPPLPSIRTRAQSAQPMPWPARSTIEPQPAPHLADGTMTAIAAAANSMSANASAAAGALAWRVASPSPVWAHHPGSPQFSVFSAMSSLFSPRMSHMVAGGNVAASHIFTGGGSTIVTSPTRHVMFRPAGPIFGPVPSRNRPRQRRPAAAPRPAGPIVPIQGVAVPDGTGATLPLDPSFVMAPAPLVAVGVPALSSVMVPTQQGMQLTPGMAWQLQPFAAQPVVQMDVGVPASAELLAGTRPDEQLHPGADTAVPMAPTLPATSSLPWTGQSSLTHHGSDCRAQGSRGQYAMLPVVGGVPSEPIADVGAMVTDDAGVTGNEEGDLALDQISGSGSMSDPEAASLLADEDELDGEGEGEILQEEEEPASAQQQLHQLSGLLPPSPADDAQLDSAMAIAATCSPQQVMHAVPLPLLSHEHLVGSGPASSHVWHKPASSFAPSAQPPSPTHTSSHCKPAPASPCTMGLAMLHRQARCSHACQDCMAPPWMGAPHSWTGAEHTDLDEQGVPAGLQLQAPEYLMVESLEVRLAAARAQSIQAAGLAAVANIGSGTPARCANTPVGSGHGTVGRQLGPRSEGALGRVPDAAVLDVVDMEHRGCVPADSGDSSAHAGHYSGVESETTAPGRSDQAPVMPFPVFAAHSQAREGVADTEGYADESPATPPRHRKQPYTEDGDSEEEDMMPPSTGCSARKCTATARHTLDFPEEVTSGMSMSKIHNDTSHAPFDDITGDAQVVIHPVQGPSKVLPKNGENELPVATDQSCVDFEGCNARETPSSDAAGPVFAPPVQCTTHSEPAPVPTPKSAALVEPYPSCTNLLSMDASASEPGTVMGTRLLQSAQALTMHLSQAAEHHHQHRSQTHALGMDTAAHMTTVAGLAVSPYAYGEQHRTTVSPHTAPVAPSHAMAMPAVHHAAAMDTQHLDPGLQAVPQPNVIQAPPQPPTASLGPLMPLQPQAHVPPAAALPDSVHALLLAQPASLHLSTPLAGNWHDPMADLPMRQAVVRYIIEALLANQPGGLRPERAATFQQCVTKVENALYRGAPTAEAYADRNTIMQRFLSLRKRLLDAQAQAHSSRGPQPAGQAARGQQVQLTV